MSFRMFCLNPLLIQQPSRVLTCRHTQRPPSALECVVFASLFLNEVASPSLRTHPPLDSQGRGIPGGRPQVPPVP